MSSRHRAWAEVDLEAFRGNLRLARARAGRARVWPVLKANAYGHGALRLAQVCAEEGVDRIGVADGGEALALREAGVRVPLLVLGTVIDAEVADLLAHRVEVGVHSEGRARQLGELARRADARLGVHLKVDVGMSRLGVRPEAVTRVAAAIRENPALELRGVMSHFPAAEGCRNPATAAQHALFLDAARATGAVLGRMPPTHSANSAALFTGLDPLGDAVRPGIALYGILPDTLPGATDLRPVLSLRTQIVFLKDVPEGTPVGYEGRWIAHHATRLAVLPIGYNDGVPWRLGAGGGGQVLVRGRRCPLVGAISMDYCTVDVGHVPGVEVGDTVSVIGRDGAEAIGAAEVARNVGTIPYEITCSIGARVRRVYKERPAATTAASA
jgi:alanine racemase